jgi:hypothetical protein
VLIRSLQCARNTVLAIAAAGVLGGALWQVAAAQGADAPLGPYVQAVTGSGAVICWATRGEQPGTFRHHRKVLSNLRPDTEAPYDIPGVGSGSLRTAPTGFRPFTFAAYGDPRDGHDVHRALIERMKEVRPAFLLSMGDLVRDGAVAEQWETFFSITGGLLRSVPLFPAIGDHEGYSQHYFDLFELPGNELWYSFDWAGCHFVALDSQSPRMPAHATREEAISWPERMEKRWQEQIRWLRGDLYDHRGAPYTFVYFHRAWRTALAAESRQDSAREVRERFGYLFREFQVDLVLTGHDHHYHHLNDGLDFVVTAGGGVPLAPVERTTDKTVKAFSAHHFLRIDVAAAGLTVSAIGPRGELLDRFEIPRKQKRSASREAGASSPAAR